MTDYVYQCDWCGNHVSTNTALVYFVPQRELGNGTWLVVPGTYCSDYCGDRASRLGDRTTSRG